MAFGEIKASLKITERVLLFRVISPAFSSNCVVTYSVVLNAGVEKMHAPGNVDRSYRWHKSNRQSARKVPEQFRYIDVDKCIASFEALHC